MKEGEPSFYRPVSTIYAYRTDGASICAYRVDGRFRQNRGTADAYRTNGLSLCAYRVIGNREAI